MDTEIKQYIITVLRDEFSLAIDESKVTDETELGPAGLNLESLTFVELAFRLEEKYGIEISDADYERIATFNTGDLVRYVAEKIPAQA